jgi:hypothetical protein
MAGPRESAENGKRPNQKKPEAPARIIQAIKSEVEPEENSAGIL